MGTKEDAKVSIHKIAYRDENSDDSDDLDDKEVSKETALHSADFLQEFLCMLGTSHEEGTQFFDANEDLPASDNEMLEEVWQ